MTIERTSNIFNQIAQFDTAAKIPALRAIVHSTMAKCIGAIRQHLRNAKREQVLKDGRAINEQRDDEQTGHGLDTRNDFDENTRSVGDLANAMGFAATVPPLKQAEIFHELYEWAHLELATLSVSKWDAPLNLDGMLTFMTTKAQPLDKALVTALADAAKCEPKMIERLHELQELKDRENLIAMLPEIKAIFDGFNHLIDHEGYDVPEGERSDGFHNLPPVAAHQLGVKVFESLGKAKEQVLSRVMRTRKITDLGSIPLIEEGVAAMKDWVEAYENDHRVALNEAIDLGLNLRTLEDAARI